MNEKKVLLSGVIVESVAKTLIVNEKNQVLVLTIGEYKEHPEKSYTPDLPGGLVEIGSGETAVAGAIREAREETGIILDASNLLLAYTRTTFYAEPDGSVSRFFYIARLDDTPAVVVSWEHASYEWIALEELLKTKSFRPFYQEAIEYSIAHNLL